MPPPAIHIVKPYGLWSRPEPLSETGVRPNSPPQTTSVSSSSPRRFRSRISAAAAWSMSGTALAQVLLDVLVIVPDLPAP